MDGLNNDSTHIYPKSNIDFHPTTYGLPLKEKFSLLTFRFSNLRLPNTRSSSYGTSFQLSERNVAQRLVKIFG